MSEECCKENTECCEGAEKTESCCVKENIRTVVTYDGTMYMGELVCCGKEDNCEDCDTLTLKNVCKIFLRQSDVGAVFYEPFPAVFPHFLQENEMPVLTFKKCCLLNANVPFDLDKVVSQEGHTFFDVYQIRTDLSQAVTEQPTASQPTDGDQKVTKLF